MKINFSSNSIHHKELKTVSPTLIRIQYLSRKNTCTYRYKKKNKKKKKSINFAIVESLHESRIIEHACS